MLYSYFCYIELFQSAVKCYILSYPPLQRSWKGGILVSPCPSVRLSVCPSVRLWTELCPLCIFNNTHRIHIYTSYQATLEGVSRVMPVPIFKNLKFWRIF